MCRIGWSGSLFLMISLLPNQGKVFGQRLGEFGFEKDGLAGWIQAKDWVEGKDVAAIDSDRPHSGGSSATFRLPAKAGKMMFRCFPLPAVKGPVERTFRLRLFVRSENLKTGDISMRVLLGYGNKRPPAWYEKFTFDDQPFLILPVSSAWTEVRGEGYLLPEVTEFSVYLLAQGGAGGGQVWFDDMTVDLFDHGLMFECGRKGNIFTGETGRMDLIVTAPEEIGSGNIILADEEQRIVRVVPVPKGNGRVAINLPGRGFYDVTARVTYQDGVTRWKHTTGAVVGPLIPDELRMQSPFGFYSWAEELAVAAGARWDRAPIDQSTDFYKQAADAGFPVTSRPAVVPSEKKTTIWIVNRQPSWIQKRPAKGPWEEHWIFPVNDEKRFKDLIRYTMTMVLPQVPDYWEVGNELDGAFKGTTAELIDFHRLSTESIKAVNPNAKILGPCPCSVKVDWINMLRNQGLFKYIDGVVVHPYVNATPPEQEFIGKLRELKAYLRAVGRADMPIYITEYGWTLPPGDWQKPVDPLTQARYCSRSLVLLVAEQIHAFTYFQLYLHHFNSAAGYALLENDYTPRPGYTAYANAARQLTGVAGSGRVFQTTPTGYLALFCRENKTIAVVWDVQSLSSFFLPKPRRAVRDMMGKLLFDAGGHTLQAGLSPVFIEMDGEAFYRVNELPRIHVGQGMKHQLPWAPEFVPKPLQAAGRELCVGPEVPKGPYLVFGKNGERWQCLAVDVTQPLEELSTDLLWPASAPDPKLRMKIRSDVPDQIEVAADVRVTGINSPPGPMITINPRSTAEMMFPLPNIQPGRRYQGEAVLTATGKTNLRHSTQLDFTVVPCRLWSAAGWKALPVVDISNWAPFAGPENKPGAIAGSDCSADFQVAYDTTGLHFRIHVRDDDHRQTKSPKEMWQEDSVQLAFDLDADKPWRANEGGCKGHVRVFEYGFALGPNGPMNWRWMSFDPKIHFDTAEDRVKTSIMRDKDETIYEILLPWPTLGAPGPLPPGSAIGFSLTVNDADQNKSERKGLRLFHGIVDAKDPEQYGKLWLRQRLDKFM